MLSTSPRHIPDQSADSGGPDENSTRPVLSFVVPAFNEEAYLGRTLQAIHASAKAVGAPYEIVVADDNSTDGTAAIAAEHGARVVSVSHRQIAATRNSGARASTGDYIFFVDADTTINPRTLGGALEAMRNGAVGGGGANWFDRSEVLPLHVRLAVPLVMFTTFVGGSVAGPFMFCTREAFDKVGGFPEKMYWGEDMGFANALKLEGRFSVPWPPVVISGRRYRRPSKQTRITGLLRRMLLAPRRLFRDRSLVQEAWYEPHREDENALPTGIGERLTRFRHLFFIVCIYVGIFWNLVPWTWAPWPGMLGTIRSVATVAFAHVGLLFLPMALAMIVHVLRRKRPTNLLGMFALIALSLWLGWNSLRTIIETYGQLWSWLTGP